MSVTKSSLQKDPSFEVFSEETAQNTTGSSAPYMGSVVQMHDKTRTAHNKLLMRKRKKSRHPLRELRLQRGYTLEELAELTRLSPSYLSRLESGTRRLNADILQRIALVLSCHPGDLLPHDSHTSKFAPQAGQWAKDSSTSTLSQDLPFYRLNAQDSGRLILEIGRAREWITRPGEMQGVSNAFAFSVADEKTSPRYTPQDRIFAHPSRSLTPDCHMVAVNASDEAFIGQFVGWRSDAAGQPDALEMRVSEYTGAGYTQKQIAIARQDLKASFRIVGTMEAA